MVSLLNVFEIVFNGMEDILTIVTVIFQMDLGQWVPDCLHSGLCCNKDDEDCGDYWISRVKLQLNRHQPTNLFTNKLFTGWCLPVAQSTL